MLANIQKQTFDSDNRIMVLAGASHVTMFLDLLKHDFEQARELYEDVWLGFSELELYEFLTHAGFHDVHITVVDRETEAPYFQTMLAIGEKAV